MSRFDGLLNFVGLSKKADLDSVSNRLVNGDIKYETWPEDMRASFPMTNSEQRVYNHFGVPIIRSLASRSYDYGDSDVYSGSEVDNIFGQAAVDTSTGKNVVDEITVGGNTSTPKDNKTWIGRNRWLPVALSAGAGAAILLWYLRRKRKRNSVNLTKKAGLYGWGARFEPHVNLFDDAATATDASDYKDVNNTFRDLVDKDLKGAKFINYNPSSETTFTWDRPFAFPGDPISAVKSDGSDGSRKNFGNAMNAVDHQLRGDGKYGISYNPRLVPITALAASMLPNGTKFYRDEPNIGNMAYVLPAVTGQYAGRTGMTEDEMARASENGLDNVVIDSIKSESARYPALKNVLSAYVNGGFGRSSQPTKFGLVRPFWDYSAQAMTPEGSNALHQVVSDIGAAGGYGGISPSMQYAKLQFNPYWPTRSKFENLGLDVDKLPAYAGNNDLRDYIYSLGDEDLSKLDQYYSWERNEPSVAGGHHGSQEAYENFWNSKAEEAERENDHNRAERIRRIPLEHPYGTPELHSSLENMGYHRDLPIDERRRMLYKFYDDMFSSSARDSVTPDYNGETVGLVRNNDRVMRIIGDKDSYRGMSPEAVEMAKRFNGPYINAAYDTYQKYLDAGDAAYKRSTTAPYVKYDETMPEKHYNELLRLVDSVGPSLFMPNTVLGRDMVYHPVGGIVPNAQRMYTTYMPYFTKDPDLVGKIDKASNGMITKGKQDLVDAAGDDAE